MSSEEYVDDPLNVEQEIDNFNQISRCEVNSLEGSFQLVNLNCTEFLKYSLGVITLQDGSQWYKIPVTLAPKLEPVEHQVEVWENIEIEKDDNINVEENLEEVEQKCIENVEHNVSVAAEVVVLDNGTIAYLTQQSSNQEDVADVNEVREERILKKQNKSHCCTQPGCERSYTSLHHLKVHVRNHTGDRPFKCNTDGCDKAFATDYSRKAHLRTHTGEKPYPCKMCIKRFKTSGDLQKHIRTHTGERPFLCPVEGCNRSFTTSNIRKVHIRTHTGERPYTCKYENCNRSFASSTNYKNHMRIHSGEKPFCCTVPNCQKRFTEYSSLYKHQLVHSQIKRYKCPFCYKMYRQMSTLTTHKRTIHGVISADDGTEIILEQMIVDGAKDSLKNFKNIAISLLNLKKDHNNILTESADGGQQSLYLVKEVETTIDC